MCRRAGGMSCMAGLAFSGGASVSCIWKVLFIGTVRPYVYIGPREHFVSVEVSGPKHSESLCRSSGSRFEVL